MKIFTLGEVLWDVFDDRRHIGGAPFNFSAHAARLGHEVTLISAVGNDELADETLASIERLGLSTTFVSRTSKAATGTVRVFVDGKGQPSYTIHRPAAYDFPDLGDGKLEQLASNQPDWIAYGTLAQMAPDMRSATKEVMKACPTAQRFYDINLRKDSFTKELILELIQEADILKINDDEVEQVSTMLEGAPMRISDFCRKYCERFQLRSVCVTRGAKGCYVQLDGRSAEVFGRPAKVADTVGAGDAFAAAFLHGAHQNWPITKVCDFANRLGALVASRHGAVPEWTAAELQD